MHLSYNLSYFDIIEKDNEQDLVLAETLAKPFERCYLKAYWDPVEFLNGKPAGYPTQGWGHLHTKVTKRQIMSKYGFDSAKADSWLQLRFPQWSQEEADRNLREDMRKARTAVSKLLPVPLSDAQRAALIDFTYNCGADNLKSSTLRKMILRGDLADAAEQFKRWNKARGIVLRGLTLRRLAERDMFLS